MTATPLPITTAPTTAPRVLATEPTRRGSLRTTAAGGAIGAVVGSAGALAVLAIANIGSPVRVITGWAPDGVDLGVADVVITTIVSVAIAAVGLAVLERVSRRGLSTWTIAVAAVTVLSCLPLWRLDLDTGSKAALSMMHLVVGAVVIGAQRFVRRPLA